ncbi:pyridoxal phosphate-dependent transferase [Tribonema minus]|uniref:Pyridoxal phosphate-dependent transferase n=1 Tax=Tribonema minus TaxID=303371 RepID=A0A835YTY7_9STRA|nr:pyridoxal phosphate-dependent transferase [Tribonema minus]
MLYVHEPVRKMQKFGDKRAAESSMCDDKSESSAIVLNKEDVIGARKACMGSNVSVSYSSEPLMMLRGRGSWLYDETGRRYLDCVNNVAHVGHCHPKVAAASCEQLGLLNTNSRYLHPKRVSYAQRLLATFPPHLGLDTVFMVCSGSEAHDILVLGGAYHGHTSALIELSPYKAPAPDVYRGPVRRDHPRPGPAYADLLADVIRDEVTAKGRKLAAFFAESIPGCAGQLVPPEGYLRAAFEHARAAGAVCIADEVQTGFGRMGSAFWAFDAQGAAPDVVTLGKPIGNGYPMAAVVTRRDIAQAFANGMEYFNTFGGSTAACAVGVAVLDVIAADGLQANAADVGVYVLARLRTLQEKHQLIGDVRGMGLFVGVELVTDRDRRAPAPEQAAAVALACRRRGVLVSTDGRHHNVLKIKPPLCFSRDPLSTLPEWSTSMCT